MNYGLVGRIVMWAVMLISVVFTIGVANDASTNSFVSFGMYLTYGAVALAILGSVFSLIIDPSNLKSVAISLGAFVVVMLIAYGISGDDDYAMYQEKYDITEGVFKMVTMGINTFIILGVLAVGAILYSTITSIFK